MRNFFKSRLFIAIVIILIGCFISFVYTGISYDISPITQMIGIVTTPIQRAITNVVNFFEEAKDQLTNYDDLLDDYNDLKNQVKEMERAVRESAVILDENNRLRALLGIKERNRDFEFEIAEVIGKSTGNWSSTITIDKGNNSGIKINSCVITEDGMVGYITDVGSTFAEVTTVIDPNMHSGSMISRTREIAVSEGNFELMGQGYLKLSYLKKDIDIVIGDTVETSGGGGIFPKGILIGTIEKIITENHGISNYAVVKPVVDLENVKKVFIIKNFEITE